MKTLTLTIYKCTYCPFSESDLNGCRLICRKKHRTICWLSDEDNVPIPDWCPLEDLEV